MDTRPPESADSAPPAYVFWPGGPSAPLVAADDDDRLAARPIRSCDFFDLWPDVTGLAFFSVWVKPETPGRLPAVVLQGEDLSVLNRALPRKYADGGWVLMAGWVRRRSQQRARIVIRQPFATACLLARATMLVIDAQRANA